MDNTASSTTMSPPLESPIRILITVKQRHPQIWQKAWEQPEQMISRVLKYLKYDYLVAPDDKYDTSDCRFIAVDRWEPVVFIVFDLFNTQYNHLDAHLDGKNELPVRVVRISQGDNSYLIKASEAQHIKYLSDEVRNLHESHGWEEKVPFRIDHYNGAYPTYYHPRALRNNNSSDMKLPWQKFSGSHQRLSGSSAPILDVGLDHADCYFYIFTSSYAFEIFDLIENRRSRI